MLTIGSLFAGIGGFDLGLERAGMRSVWQSEINPYCQRVLARHWPDVLRVPDVRNVGADTVPQVDVICGGFPCQDLSVAGGGAGLGGARSGLWGEYARIVGELRPRYVIVENVAALLARGLGTVLADLATLGYDAEWDCIPAAAVGAPHIRDRIWIVAYPHEERRDGRSASRATSGSIEANGSPQRGPSVAHSDDQRRAEGLRLAAGRDERQGPRDAERSGEHALGYSDGEGQLQPQGCELDEWRRACYAGWWATEPDVGRVAHGVPSRMDRTAALGNALIPAIAEWVGRRVMTYENSRALQRKEDST